MTRFVNGSFMVEGERFDSEADIDTRGFIKIDNGGKKRPSVWSNKRKNVFLVVSPAKCPKILKIMKGKESYDFPNKFLLISEARRGFQKKGLGKGGCSNFHAREVKKQVHPLPYIPTR